MAYRPTAKDLAVFERSRSDGSIFAAYYFDGFAFRDRPWQQAFHHAKQDDITVIAGVGSGKTTGVGLSAATYAATLPYFRFMNVAPTLWQAMLMYNSILMWADGAEFAKFIVNSVTRPYPKITLYNGSTLEFMSAANNLWRIQGWEGDWMNLDEGGLIEDGDLSIANMGTRLRGNIKGRRRLGRLSVVGMSSEAPWLWERLDMGAKDPENYLSIVTRTAENLDPEDVERMKRRIPKELWAVHLEGQRPVGTGEEFSYQVIQRCEDRDLNRWIEEEIVEETDGFIYEEAPSIGCIRCQFPPLKGHRYILAADVGQSNPPLRFDDPAYMTVKRILEQGLDSFNNNMAGSPVVILHVPPLLKYQSKGAGEAG